MLAIHLDNILFLLFVAVAILFQLLTRAATKSRRRPGSDPQRRSTSPTPPRREETEEDRLRKFLGAVCEPATSKPPPPVIPRTDIPPTPVAPIAPPREMLPNPTWRTLKRELQREITLPQQIPPTREAKPLESAPVIKTPETHAIATATLAQAPESKVDLATLLR